jgi:hypothetical protein
MKTSPQYMPTINLPSSASHQLTRERGGVMLLVNLIIHISNKTQKEKPACRWLCLSNQVKLHF